jgi:hypothetical protein
MCPCLCRCARAHTHTGPTSCPARRPLHRRVVRQPAAVLRGARGRGCVPIPHALPHGGHPQWPAADPVLDALRARRHRRCGVGASRARHWAASRPPPFCLPQRCSLHGDTAASVAVAVGVGVLRCCPRELPPSPPPEWIAAAPCGPCLPCCGDTTGLCACACGLNQWGTSWTGCCPCFSRPWWALQPWAAKPGCTGTTDKPS